MCMELIATTRFIAWAAKNNGMDIISHGLWAGVVYRAVGPKKRRLSLWLFIFWSVFPDIFWGGLPFVWGIVNFFHPLGIDSYLRIYSLGFGLYNFSHSAVIMLLAFSLVYAVKKRPPWEMLGWILHVGIDMFTHVSTFLPTPIFYPISNWTFSLGFSWEEPWFIILNWTGIFIAYAFLFRNEINSLLPPSLKFRRDKS